MLIKIIRIGHHFKIKLYHHNLLKFHNFKNQSELSRYFLTLSKFSQMVMFVTSKLPSSVRLFIFVYIFVSLEILFAARGIQESVFIINRII